MSIFTGIEWLVYNDINISEIYILSFLLNIN